MRGCYKNLPIALYGWQLSFAPQQVSLPSCLQQPSLLPEAPICVRALTLLGIVSGCCCFAPANLLSCKRLVLLQPLNTEEGVEDGGFIFQPDQTQSEAPFVAADAPLPAQLLPCAELPAFAKALLASLLPAWEDVRMSSRRMTHSPLSDEVLQV